MNVKIQDNTNLTLTFWPKINRVPPYIIHNFHVEFEIDQKLSPVSCGQKNFIGSSKFDLHLSPATQNE